MGQRRFRHFQHLGLAAGAAVIRRGVHAAARGRYFVALYGVGVLRFAVDLFAAFVGAPVPVIGIVRFQNAEIMGQRRLRHFQHLGLAAGAAVIRGCVHAAARGCYFVALFGVGVFRFAADRFAVLAFEPVVGFVALRYVVVMHIGSNSHDAVDLRLALVKVFPTDRALIVRHITVVDTGRRDGRNQRAVIVRTVGIIADGSDHVRLVGRAQLIAAGAAPIGHRTRGVADRGRNRLVIRPGVSLRRDLVCFRGGKGLAADGRRGGEGPGAGHQVLRVHDRGLGNRRGQGDRAVVLLTADYHGRGVGFAARGPVPIGFGGRDVGVAGGAVGRFDPLGGGAGIGAVAHRHRGGIFRGGVIDAAGGIGIGLNRYRRRDRMVAAVAGKGRGHGPAVPACRPVAPRRRGGIAVHRAGSSRINVCIGGDVVEGLIPRYRIMVIVVGGLGRQVLGRCRRAVGDILRRADLVAVQVIEFHFIGPGGVGILRGIGRHAGDLRNGGRPAAEGVDAFRGLITGLGGGRRGGRLAVFHRGGCALRALRGGVVPRDLIRARGGRVGSGIGLPRVGIAHHGRAARGNGGRPDGVDIIVLRARGLRRNGGDGERIAVVRGNGPELRAVLIVERRRTGLLDKVQTFVAVGVGVAGAAEEGDGLLNVDGAVLRGGGGVRTIGIHRVVRVRRYDLREGRLGAVHGSLRVHPSVGDYFVIAVQCRRKRSVNGLVVKNQDIALCGDRFVICCSAGPKPSMRVVYQGFRIFLIILTRIPGTDIDECVAVIPTGVLIALIFRL